MYYRSVKTFGLQDDSYLILILILYLFLILIDPRRRNFHSEIEAHFIHQAVARITNC